MTHRTLRHGVDLFSTAGPLSTAGPPSISASDAVGPVGLAGSADAELAGIAAANAAIPHRGWSDRVLLALALLVLVPLLLLALGGCKKESSAGNGNGNGPAGSDTSAANAAPPADALVLTFAYGSEKKDWIADCTTAFNAEARKTPDGKPVFVRHLPMGSGECVDEVLAGRLQAHLLSPASGVFVTQGNAKRQTTAGQDLVGPTENLVLSPVVIGMWKPMAEALGWPAKPVGWRDVLELARDPRGWAGRGHPEWGPFRFGHTHSEYSNSGVISVLATLYAAAGKTHDLSESDLAKPDVAAFLRDIERAVVHYGSSTGFFADRMAEGGPGYLSAAVLYESSVIESYGRPTPAALPMVAVYPKEGTFWSDHPVGAVNREWVTDAHRAAAKQYVEYLRAEPQQRKALRYGFRPADTAVAVSAPVDAAHGVDPEQPKATLPVPPAAVVDRAVGLWRANKKHADVVLVFDTSGSMQEQNKIVYARDGAADLVDLLGEGDRLSLLPFSSEPTWAFQRLPMRAGVADAKTRIAGLIPDGATALYDATSAAYDQLAADPRPDRISAVVVLTDGMDSGKGATLDALLGKIGATNERTGVRVFTIAYGADAKLDVLSKISAATRARSYKGDTATIRAVFKEIATFF